VPAIERALAARNERVWAVGEIVSGTGAVELQ
jgi:hypothetical protein